MIDYDTRNRDILKRLAAGASMREVAAVVGISKQRIGQISLQLTGRPHGKRRLKWPTERERMLRKLWPTGLSYSKLAQRLGVSRNAVICKAHRLGLPPRKIPENFRPHGR
jgi:DNA-binding CsgD family transcriptional regulator